MHTDSAIDVLPDISSEIPYEVYHNVPLYAVEQRQIFQGEVWSYLCLDAELPEAGDFKSTFVGDTPVVVTRDGEGVLRAWVNRCAHKGATVCRSNRGNSADGTFTCVYHQWAYNSAGDLCGVPFRRGLRGVGGLDPNFDLAQHGLQKLRVQSVSGMVFGAFSSTVADLEDYLGIDMCHNIKRILQKPIKILGYARQYMRGNWKLYSENSRDSYHGGLLHLFYPTFGIYRQSQESYGTTSDQGFHNLFNVMTPDKTIDYDEYKAQANRELNGVEQLQDPSVLQFRPDLEDGIGLSIQSLFPSVVLQQIQNTLATRQVLPKSVDSTELVWTYFGYDDDDEEMTRHRIKNINLVGPAGFISMEDGEAVEMCQDATSSDECGHSYIKMGGEETTNVSPIGMDENAVRGFWKGYLELMRKPA